MIVHSRLKIPGLVRCKELCLLGHLAFISTELVSPLKTKFSTLLISVVSEQNLHCPVTLIIHRQLPRCRNSVRKKTNLKVLQEAVTQAPLHQLWHLTRLEVSVTHVQKKRAAAAAAAAITKVLQPAVLRRHITPAKLKSQNLEMINWSEFSIFHQ